MSAYITLATPMIDEESLVEAIVDSGVDRSAIEVSRTPLTLKGWRQGRTANVILRKQVTGDHYNDIGFLRTAIGYRAVLSDDHARFGRTWLASVITSYQDHWLTKQDRLAVAERARLAEERRQLVEAQRKAVTERAKKMGYRVKETRSQGKVRLVLIKRTY